MTALYILGPAEIRNSQGNLEHSFLAGPKRLALLSYLLLSRPRGFHRRDSLLPLFWPDQNQKSARNALSNMLYHIRKTLGKSAVLNRGVEEVAVNPEAFWSDALAFEKAIAAKDNEAALEHYRSELLKGFYVSDISPEFEHWLEQERRNFHILAVEACRKVAEGALDKKDRSAAGKWAKKAAAMDPFSESLQLWLIDFLNSCGDKEAAFQAYRDYASLLEKEFEEKPGAEFRKLVEEIQKQPEPVPLSPAGNSSVRKKGSLTSIAVLPFETLGADKPSAFTDAVHGDLLTRLSKVAELFVISRTSVISFRGTKKLLPEIAQELQVEWILSGEVQEIGHQVKVSPRLVNAAEDRLVWAEIYQRQLTAENIFLIEDEITKDILETLKVRLTGKEEQRVTGKPTSDLNAYRLYIQGRNCLDQRTESAIYQGLDCFQGAIEIDPGYALAWSGMADALSILTYYRIPLPGNSPDGMKAALESLSLDPGLGEAHASVGIAHSVRKEGPAALQELEKAVHYTPNYAEALVWLGWVNLLLGRPDKAPEPARQGVRLSPLAPAFRVFLSEIYLANGMFQEALKEARRAREINPDYGLVHYMEGLVLYHCKAYSEAVAALERALAIIPARGTPGQAEVSTALAFSYNALGEPQWAMDFKGRIYGRIDPFPLAMLQVLHGELDEAFRSLERIKDWSSFSNETLRYFFPEVLAPLRADKRYQKLLETLNKAWGLQADGSLE